MTYQVGGFNITPKALPRAWSADVTHTVPARPRGRSGEGETMAIEQATTPGRPLSEAAYRALRARVLTCRLSPGERLTERPTAAELGLVEGMDVVAIVKASDVIVGVPD